MLRRVGRRSILALAPLFLATSAQGQQPTPSDAGSDVAVPRKRALSVAVLGSSTAAGVMLHDPSTSWVARYTTWLLAQRPGSRVTNLAIPGYTTFQVLPTGTTNPPGRPSVDPAHNVTAALAVHPDAIFVNLPSNDAVEGIPVDESVENLRTLVATAERSGVAVWLASPQPRALKGEAMALLLGLRDRMKREFPGRIIDFFSPLAK